MAKKTVKAVTRKQKYLAAIAGDGVAPSPITSDEKLMYNIAEKVNEGGSSGGGVLSVNVVKSGTELFSGTLPNVTGYAWRHVMRGTDEYYYIDFSCDLEDVTFNKLSVSIDGKTNERFITTYDNGTVSIQIGCMAKMPINDYGYTNESDVIGKTLTLYADLAEHLDRTWQDIHDADFAVVIATTENDKFVSAVGDIGHNVEMTDFYVTLVNGDTYSASSASDYPMPLEEIEIEQVSL